MSLSQETDGVVTPGGPREGSHIHDNRGQIESTQNSSQGDKAFIELAKKKFAEYDERIEILRQMLLGSLDNSSSAKKRSEGLSLKFWLDGARSEAKRSDKGDAVAKLSAESGVRFVQKFVDSKGALVREQDKDLLNETEQKFVLPSEDVHPLAPDHLKGEKWLEVVQIIVENSKSALIEEDSDWELRVYDTRVQTLLLAALDGYAEHTGKRPWQKNPLIITSGVMFLVLILNMEDLKDDLNHNLKANQYADDADTGLHVLQQGEIPTRARLQRMLNIVYSKSDKDMVQAARDFASFKENPGLEAARELRISHSSLGVLFRPGSLVVTPWLSQHKTYLQVFRVHHFGREKIDNVDNFCVRAWLWDWDGENLVRTIFKHRIPTYKDQKSVTELTVYPIDFYHINGRWGREALYTTPFYSNRREQFRSFTIDRYGNHDVLHYRGEVIHDNGIEGDDSLHLNLRPRSAEFAISHSAAKIPQVMTIDEQVVLDTVHYVRNSGSVRWLGELEPSREAPCECRWCNDQETQSWLRTMMSKRAIDATAMSSTSVTNESNDTSDNNLLLSPRVLGYGLERKTWCQFHLSPQEISGGGVFSPINAEKLREIVYSERLVERERDDIFTLVRNHFAVVNMDTKNRITDTIGGKGESLVLLFHGYSGTGKTLYAEALAAQARRPLLKVGTSDIGLEAFAAEQNLRDIFKLAESWNAVLLIDEADVLLNTRGTNMDSAMQENALVSVLLREVEYFKGILIMTTNRVQAFDSAVLSRIHHAVNFEAVTQEQEARLLKHWVQKIADKNLTKDKGELLAWVDDICRKPRRTAFSGREVRNIFVTAQTLATNNGDASSRAPPYITREHLQRAWDYRSEFRTDTAQQMKAGDALHARPSESRYYS